jgi:hypothetical protein
VAQHPVSGVQKGLCRSGSAVFRVPGSRVGAGDFLLVRGIPGRTASHYTPRHPAPFRDLTVVGAHPVHRYRRKPPFFTIACETEPARGELRSDCAPRPRIGPAVAEHPQLDETHGVFDRSASLHFPALNGGGMNHPYFPDLPSCVQKGAISRVFCGFNLHWNPWGRMSSSGAKHKPRFGAWRLAATETRPTGI